MKILFVASEAAPFVKTGGLGDVIGALPRALARRGHELLVVLPRYGQIKSADGYTIRDTGRRIEVQLAGGPVAASVHVCTPEERLRYLFLSHPFYERAELYGENGSDYRDNQETGIFFAEIPSPSKCRLWPRPRLRPRWRRRAWGWKCRPTDASTRFAASPWRPADF